MAWVKGMWRKLPKDTEKAKELKKRLKECTNSIESKRMNIMIVYLNWSNVVEVQNTLWVSWYTVIQTINRYIEDQDNFYKTKYPWRPKSNEWKTIEERINKIIVDAYEKWEYLDIHWIQERYNKKYKKSKILNYRQTWTVVRERLKYKYQKPYIVDKRKPENAEKIVKERIREAIEKVAKKEWIEVKRLKNKKIDF